MLIEKKDVDFHLGMLPDEVIYTVLREYNFDDSWIVLPFMNVNNKALAINRRSETARKAIILYKDELYILKEVPWYCSDINFVRYETELQEKLRKYNNCIPLILRTVKGNLFTQVYYDNQEKIMFLQKYIVGNSWSEDEEQFQSTAESIAKLHLVMHESSNQIKEQLSPPEASVFILANKMLDVLSQKLEEKANIISYNDMLELKNYCDNSSKLVNELEAAAMKKGYGDIKIPVHGDYNPWNLIYDPKSHKVIGIIDFDNSIIDNPVHDIAESILDFCFFTYKGKTTRFQNVPNNLKKDKALIYLKKYLATCRYEHKAMKNYLLEAVLAVAIELISLGLVRGDYSFTEINEIEKVNDLLRSNIESLIKDAFLE